ncbi:hypothetical protein RU639_000008 [Aspergillus parasiticus]
MFDKIPNFRINPPGHTEYETLVGEGRNMDALIPPCLAKIPFPECLVLVTAILKSLRGVGTARFSSEVLLSPRGIIIISALCDNIRLLLKNPKLLAQKESCIKAAPTTFGIRLC